MSNITFIPAETLATLEKVGDTGFKTTVTGIVNTEDGPTTVFLKTADKKNVSFELPVTPAFGIGDTISISTEGVVTITAKEEPKDKKLTRASGSDGSRGIVTAASLML